MNAMRVKKNMPMGKAIRKDSGSGKIDAIRDITYLHMYKDFQFNLL